jgi:hypothetical protein
MTNNDGGPFDVSGKYLISGWHEQIAIKCLR